MIENSEGSDLLIYGGLDENDPELNATIEDIGGGVEWLRMKNYDNIFYLSDWDEWEGHTSFYEIGEPLEITYKFSTPHMCEGDFFIDGNYLYVGGRFSHIYIFDLETASGAVEPIGDYQDYGCNLYCNEYESNNQKYLYHFQTTAFSIYEIDGYGIDPEPEVPEQYFTPYPNPFSTSTTISFHENTRLFSDAPRQAEIRIYNIKGQLIRELKIENLKLKMNEVVWDGRDENGIKVGAGVYFYKLTGIDEHIGKVVKLK